MRVSRSRRTSCSRSSRGRLRERGRVGARAVLGIVGFANHLVGHPDLGEEAQVHVLEDDGLAAHQPAQVDLGHAVLELGTVGQELRIGLVFEARRRRRRGKTRRFAQHQVFVDEGVDRGRARETPHRLDGLDLGQEDRPPVDRGQDPFLDLARGEPGPEGRGAPRGPRRGVDARGQNALPIVTWMWYGPSPGRRLSL